MNKLKIKSDVEGLIKKYKLTVPIDVERLASSLGIEIRKQGFDDELSGFAFHRQGEKFIGINTNENEKRQRFTIAHEIGHMQLHDKHSLSVDKGVMMLLRNDHSSDGTDLKEIEANRFAAELLMPEKSIKADLIKVGGVDLVGGEDLRNSTISKLADKYEVSYQAMSIRLVSIYFS